MKVKTLLAAAILSVVAISAYGSGKSAGELLAENGVAFKVTKGYAGAPRYNFTFEGRKAYFDEPANAKKSRQWMWCMMWPNAFAEFTGQIDGVRRGYCYVHLSDLDWMSPKGIKVAKRFRDFLVDKLGFADKAFLIGMSWGGFYSTRYAAAYPEDVARIYLDAPLMNFAAFELKKWGPAARSWGEPENGDWAKDPRMPINLAEKIAKAKIPVLLLYGAKDTTVPPAENCELFISRFKAAGGDIQVIRRGDYGHHPHGFKDPAKKGAVVDFFEGKSL